VYPFDTERLSDDKNNKIRRQSDEIVFLTASNFNIKDKVEGLDFLFEAMTKIEKKDGLKLLVFGNGKYLEHYKQRYQDYETIVFMGFRNDFAEFLKNSDVYLHISGLDNQPYAIIDALMQGKVVICNDLGGMVETINLSNNYVVKLDPSSIHNALLKVISEITQYPDQFQQKGLNNKIFAKNKYSSKVISNEYVHLYRELTKGR
jgi:glycosyltransferase involved in cell wall biosynthesis